jgi:hypothetical protein
MSARDASSRASAPITRKTMGRAAGGGLRTATGPAVAVDDRRRRRPLGDNPLRCRASASATGNFLSGASYGSGREARSCRWLTASSPRNGPTFGGHTHENVDKHHDGAAVLGHGAPVSASYGRGRRANARWPHTPALGGRQPPPLRWRLHGRRAPGCASGSPPAYERARALRLHRARAGRRPRDLAARSR